MPWPLQVLALNRPSFTRTETHISSIFDACFELIQLRRQLLELDFELSTDLLQLRYLLPRTVLFRPSLLGRPLAPQRMLIVSLIFMKFSLPSFT